MRQLRTVPWLARHAIAIVLFVSFLGLGWWQVRRAEAGNLLSYAYAVEWPVFAAFVVFVWFKELQLARHPARGPGAESGTAVPAARDAAKTPDRAQITRPPVIRTAPPPAGAYDDPDDAELAAYNRYLAWLNAHPDAALSRYRDRPDGVTRRPDGVEEVIT